MNCLLNIQKTEKNKGNKRQQRAEKQQLTNVNIEEHELSPEGVVSLSIGPDEQDTRQHCGDEVMRSPPSLDSGPVHLCRAKESHSNQGINCNAATIMSLIPSVLGHIFTLSFGCD